MINGGYFQVYNEIQSQALAAGHVYRASPSLQHLVLAFSAWGGGVTCMGLGPWTGSQGSDFGNATV